MPILYMLMGYPGAGKTTAAKQLEQLTGAVRLSSDDIRLQVFPQPTFSLAEHAQLYNELNRRTAQLLESGRDVIYDANLNRYQHRKEKYAICQQTGAQASLLWVQAPKELAKNRATHQTRSHLATPTETLAEMFERVANVIEPPAQNEPYTVIDGTKISADYIKARLRLP